MDIAADNSGAVRMFVELGFQPEALLRDHLVTPMVSCTTSSWSRTPSTSIGPGCSPPGSTRRFADARARGQRRDRRDAVARSRDRRRAAGAPHQRNRRAHIYVGDAGAGASRPAADRIRRSWNGTVRPLLPGHDPGNFTWLARRVLDEAGIERADVLGYSMGGFVAQQLAAFAPERVRRLVLVSTSCGWGGLPGRLSAFANVATPLRYWSPAFYRRTIGSRGRRPSPARCRVGRSPWRDAPPPPADDLGYLGQVLSSGGWSGLSLLGRIGQPTLVVTGDDDPLVPAANALLLAHRLPHARVFVAPGEGHPVLMDPDSAVLEPIREFLHADRLDESLAWSAGDVVGEADVRAAVSATRRQAQPWGAPSSVMRALNGQRARAASCSSARAGDSSAGCDRRLAACGRVQLPHLGVVGVVLDPGVVVVVAQVLQGRAELTRRGVALVLELAARGRVLGRSSSAVRCCRPRIGPTLSVNSVVLEDRVRDRRPHIAPRAGVPRHVVVAPVLRRHRDEPHDLRRSGGRRTRR